MIDKKQAEECFQQGIEFEEIISLVGTNVMRQLEGIKWLLHDKSVEEVLEILELEDVNLNSDIIDTFVLENLCIDYRKLGLIAQVNIRNWEWESENTASSKAGSRCYLIYADDHQELVDKAIAKAEDQRKEEKEKDLKE